MTKQASIASFFGAGAVKPKKKTEKVNSTEEKKEESKQSKPSPKTSKLDLEDTDDEQDVPLTKEQTAKRSKKNKVPAKPAPVQRKKQRILEESDEEVEDVEMKDTKNTKDTEDTKDTKDTKENDKQDKDEDYKANEEESDESDAEDEDIPLEKLKKEPKKPAKASPKKSAFAMMKSASKSASSSKSSTSSTSNKKPTVVSSAASLTKDDKSWKENAPTPYSVLCETLSKIEAISSRLEIQKLLTDLFRTCLLKQTNIEKKEQHDILTLVYLASNSVAAAYECVELGIGDSILIKAIGEASGTAPKMIKQKYEADGDLGTVAMTAKGKQRTLGFGIKPKPLAAKEVLQVFREIANTTGGKSQNLKVGKIKGLLVRVQNPEESKYIIRGLQGKLRIGLAQSTVLVSLAHAMVLSPPIPENDPKFKMETDVELSEDGKKVQNTKLPLDTRLESAVNVVKKAYSQVSSFDALVSAMLTVPLSHLNIECTLRPGMPVEPMLAKPTKSIQEVLKRLDGKRFTCEFKYDGERAQVHMAENGVTKVFSRSLLDTSEKFPEVPKYVKEACVETDVKSFVLDTEVVAYNRETKQFVPFQILSTRKKTEESEENAKVKVIVQAFDLMYLNGVSLLDHTLSERRDLMKKHFKAVDGKFQFATALDHKEDGDTTMLETFLDTAVKGQCEGLMVKTLDENATYQPSYRSLNWLKLKKDYLEGMGDSVDLVPIGAYHGRGKRTGVYGAYLLACYDVDSEEYQSVCKIGTGFSDEDLKSLSKGLNEHIIEEKAFSYNVSDSLACDVWFDSCQVWEVKAADLSKSSTHKGAVDKTGEAGRGIGLRFPRFERLRDDKRPDQATTSDQILEMYYAQDSVVDTGGMGDF
ncbi:ligase [Chaetoceros tenuissimus]|uniref:DNA ligase n=1 Tax=Chaetoceros tenuissimus TaxID=426638 RepID=A0AAD3HBE3_9STRA|nr:ligase [Chaetoceros tenuissimus]